jgi:hypothetical protein
MYHSLGQNFSMQVMSPILILCSPAKVKFLSIVVLYVNFMATTEVQFENDGLSKVSFLNSDITRVVFDAKTTFGNSKSLEDRFRIFDERRFDDCVRARKFILWQRISIL